MKILLIFALFFTLSSSQELMRLATYKDQNISGWLLSEKLDGIRAYWDGKNLLSRGKKIINAPKFFTQNFPKFELDGELYCRCKFEKIQSIVMDKNPNEKMWSDIRYYVFDAPTQNGGLLERLKVVQNFISKQESSSLKIIKQTKVNDRLELDRILDEIVSRGGEGVVIREPNAKYTGHRSELNLKYKKFHDAECEVVGINFGKGKFSDVLGSIDCKMKSGKIFKIGSGFSDDERKNPPKIGDIITYKYQNLTSHSLPRFPIFLHVRKD